ncbi:MAG: 4Fe-4S dicluster domain-containing protein [Ruminococcus sp.]|nr:4Fe-4S dicluster domain-containing protein [Ruminococcus sp.]
MTANEYLRFIVEQIHSTVVATVDEDGLPVTCVIDMMYADENGLYFLTAKGKNFYQRLKNKGYLALSGKSGEDTMNCTAISVRGRVKEIGAEMLSTLFKHNRYMFEIYPTDESRKALTVFQIYEGSGEWFDLSKKPIERDSFTFGGAQSKVSGYYITEDCIGCGSCLGDCPQSCIDITGFKSVIRQENCLHCGNCAVICPESAVVKR